MNFDLQSILAALALVGVGVGLSIYQRVKLEKDILIGTVRTFVQLIAIGYALNIIFDLDHILLILLTVMVMVVIGGYTAGRRADLFFSGFSISTLSIGLGTFSTLGFMLLLGIINIDPKYVIPLGGMMVGNSMNASALALERLDSEVRGKRALVEQRLALGATCSLAIEDSFRKTVKAAMIPILNVMKVIGLVQLPGAMTGMILAGASPLSAVIIQIIVMYMLVSSVTISAVLTTVLARSRYFTKDHQIVEVAI
ncbi:MAG: hypothetical protein AMJ90_06420 [candidate division Zixibacteria bacterium SM23_73_2]|nr:MAG: hypothetical protein AMJ90_06420 [candidate division Zixibacteria bacterium SM23_73_2]